jgi:hypothetical protein
MAMEVVAERISEVQPGTWCVYGMDLGKEARCGMEGSTLYRAVNGRPTATNRPRKVRVTIEEEDLACSMQAAFAGAGGCRG